MYTFQPWIDALNAMFGDFQKLYPRANVSLEVAPFAETFQKLEAAAIAGTPVDVSIIDPANLQKFADSGFLTEMEPLLKREKLSLDLWFEPALLEGRYDRKAGINGTGPLYAMPGTFVGTLAYYNKNLFQSAGLREPAENWTWDDLVQLATKLTKTGGDPAAAQYGVVLGGRIREAMIWGAGGEFVAKDGTRCLLDTPASIKGIAFQADLMHKHKVVPVGEALAALPSPPFPNGRVGIAFEGSWNLDTWVKELTFDWDIAPVPVGPTGKRVAYVGTNMLALWKNGRAGEHAWELLKFMLTEPGMKYFAETGTPGYKKTAESDVYLKPGGRPPHRKYVLDLAKHGRPFGSLPFQNFWNPEYNKVWPDLVANKLSPEAAAKQMCEQINRVLQEERAKRGSAK
jgi:multiple sugar transport system substrate-binding protein